MQKLNDILAQPPQQTVKQWLEGLRDSHESTEADDVKMTNLLIRVGFPKATCVCGVCYLEGFGMPVSIHSMANQLLKTAGSHI